MPGKNPTNPLSPKLIKNKYPAFGLPRGTTTSGGMGIGLDDYIFNNSKKTEVSNTPRKTKATDQSATSRPEERNSTYVWSRGSSTRTNRIRGVNTEGANSAMKTPTPHIGI